MTDSQRFLGDKQQHIETLISIWPLVENVKARSAKWGDELEYLIVELDHDTHNVRISPRASNILEGLRQHRAAESFDAEAYQFMLESQPQRPYGDSLQDLADVERNMVDRREIIRTCLSQNERVVTLTNFALLGSSGMQFHWKDLVTDKKRYKDLMTNVPDRARDIEGNYGYDLALSCCEKTTIRLDDPIYGLAGCGLQVTVSAKDLEEACRLHDQLVPLGPLMLALSAATPIYKGKLVASDTRWATMCMACDDRRSSEKQNTLPRLGCNPMYLEECPISQACNDHVFTSPDGFELSLRDNGVPPAMSTYFAHILGRDPMMDRSCMPDIDDQSDNARKVRERLLDTHMSTWWPHVRLKLPTVSESDAPLPWRVEFRPMEAQPRDKDNASLVVAMKLLQETIAHHSLDLRIPISAVEDNMTRANAQNAATTQDFWFSASTRKLQQVDSNLGVACEGWLSLDAIFNGGTDDCGRCWPGLVSLAKTYLEHMDIDLLHETQRQQIVGALDLLSARANGTLKTPAQWMRTFIKVQTRGDLHGSEVPPEAYYAMIRELSGQDSRYRTCSE